MDLEEFQNKLGYTFKDPDLLSTALQRGATNEPTMAVALEHVGDAVVSLVVRELLTALYGNRKQDYYQRLVNNHTMALISRRIPLQAASDAFFQYEHYLVSKSIANLLEAVIGALYQDGGLLAAQNLIWRIFPFQGILVHDFVPPEVKGKLIAEKLLREFENSKFLIKDAYEASPFKRSIDYHVDMAKRKDANFSPGILYFEIEMAHKWDTLFMPNDIVKQAHKAYGPPVSLQKETDVTS